MANHPDVPTKIVSQDVCTVAILVGQFHSPCKHHRLLTTEPSDRLWKKHLSLAEGSEALPSALVSTIPYEANLPHSVKQRIYRHTPRYLEFRKDLEVDASR
jgi:hypothetical protein